MVRLHIRALKFIPPTDDTLTAEYLRAWGVLLEEYLGSDVESPAQLLGTGEEEK